MAIAFKEWAMVGDELESGRQQLILRKGGIAEGREGFSFQHPEFYLMPTYFHEQATKLRVDKDRVLPEPEDGQVRISLFAKVTWTKVLHDWDTIAALQPFHIWEEQVIRERFEYDAQPGVSVAMVRAYTLEPEWRFPDEKKYGGCRSWVTIPDRPEDVGLRAVLSDEVFQNKSDEIQSVL